MKKILFIGLLLFGLMSHRGANNSILQKSINTSVYICNSSTAKKYHFSKECRGLGACKHDIKKVTLKEAKGKYKRTLCGWED